MSWASSGLVRPDGLAFAPGTEKRSHNSKAGSARGVLRTWANFFTSTAGVACLDAGDEIGDELLARFRPLRGSSGDMATGWPTSLSLRQRTRWPGERFSASRGASGLLSRSCHVVRPAGVTALSVLTRAGGEGRFGVVSLASGSGGASNWKVCSLLFVFAETGRGGGGTVVRAAGPLFDRCHCGRWDVDISIVKPFPCLGCLLRTLKPRLCSEKDFVRGIAPSWVALSATCMYSVQVLQNRRWHQRVTIKGDGNTNSMLADVVGLPLHSGG